MRKIPLSLQKICFMHRGLWRHTALGFWLLAAPWIRLCGRPNLCGCLPLLLCRCRRQVLKL